MKIKKETKKGKLHELPIETDILTQGILSLTDKNGDVIIKVSSCCYGKNAKKLAKKIITYRMTEPEKIYNEAIACGFGNEECLVVMSKSKTIHKGYGRIPSKYRQHFHQPTFNPRRGLETREKIVVISVNDFY